MTLLKIMFVYSNFLSNGFGVKLKLNESEKVLVVL